MMCVSMIDRHENSRREIDMADWRRCNRCENALMGSELRGETCNHCLDLGYASMSDENYGALDLDAHEKAHDENDATETFLGTASVLLGAPTMTETWSDEYFTHARYIVQSARRDAWMKAWRVWDRRDATEYSRYAGKQSALDTATYLNVYSPQSERARIDRAATSILVDNVDDDDESEA